MTWQERFTASNGVEIEYALYGDTMKIDGFRIVRNGYTFPGDMDIESAREAVEDYQAVVEFLQHCEQHAEPVDDTEDDVVARLRAELAQERDINATLRHKLTILHAFTDLRKVVRGRGN